MQYIHRSPKNRVIYLVIVSLPRGWELNLVVIVEVKVSIREEEIIVKEFIVGIYALELNLFGLVARVSYYRVYRRELKLIAACLTTL